MSSNWIWGAPALSPTRDLAKVRLHTNRDAATQFVMRTRPNAEGAEKRRSGAMSGQRLSLTSTLQRALRWAAPRKALGRRAGAKCST